MTDYIYEPTDLHHADTKSAKPRLRLVAQTAGQRGDGYVALFMSSADIAQLKTGRKPCGKMNLSVDRPGIILMSIENAHKLAMGKDRCSWQQGDNTPAEFRLTERELDQQANIYAAALAPAPANSPVGTRAQAVGAVHPKAQ